LLQGIEILDFAFEFGKRIDQRLQTRNLFDVSLSALAIIPKITCAHPPLESG